jgi:transcriptional regulator with XRE-family HTH domain
MNGELIRNTRESHGITMTELAARCACSENTIRQIERGHSDNPCLKTVAGIASVLNLSLDEVCGYQK